MISNDARAYEFLVGGFTGFLTKLSLIRNVSSDGLTAPDVTLTLENPLINQCRVLQITAEGVSGLKIGGTLDSQNQLALRVEDVRNRQWEGIAWRVFDSGDALEFYCSDFFAEIQSIQAQGQASDLAPENRIP